MNLKKLYDASAEDMVFGLGLMPISEINPSPIIITLTFLSLASCDHAHIPMTT